MVGNPISFSPPCFQKLFINLFQKGQKDPHFYWSLLKRLKGSTLLMASNSMLLNVSNATYHASNCYFYRLANNS